MIDIPPALQLKFEERLFEKALPKKPIKGGRTNPLIVQGLPAQRFSRLKSGVEFFLHLPAAVVFLWGHKFDGFL